MTNKFMLIANGAVLVGLIVAILLVFAGEPDEARQPNEGAMPAPDAQTEEGSQESDTSPSQHVPDTPPVRELVSPTATQEPASPTATTGSLLVKVRWSDGDPAPGIAVSFRTATRGLPIIVLAREISDEEGQIQIADLPAGSVRLRSDRGGTLKVDVVAGRLTECEFTLPEGIEVMGMVTDRSDRPVAGAGVWLQTESSDWAAGRIIARTTEDGTFALSEIPSGLSLGAVAEGYAPSQLVDLDTVDTSSSPVEVRLVLENGSGVVEGRVVSDAGSPIQGVIVAVGKRPSHMDFRGNDQWIEKWTVRTATSDEDGRFVVAGIKTGTWPVAARAEGYGFSRSDVEVLAGKRAWLDLTLGAAVTVTGIVTDQYGEPYVGATVRAYDVKPETPFIQGGQIDFDKTFGYVGAKTDEQGRYRLSSVTPGHVNLFAQAKKDSSFSKTVPYTTAVLDAEPGDEIEWNPVIKPGRTIEGTVLYDDGQPMGNVFITAKDEQGGPQHVLVNDEEGHFRFICLEGASYSLHVQYWSPPKGTPPLEKGGVVPGQGPVELRAPFSKPVEGAKGAVTGRIDDVGNRVAHAKALNLHLLSSKNWWRTHPEMEGGIFRFDDVEAGRYRVLAFAGENAIAQRDWFDLAPGQELDIGTLTTDPPGSLVIVLERGKQALDLEPTLYLSLEGWSRGSQVKMGRSSEACLDNLTAGQYKVTGHASGMVSLEGEVEVRVGEQSEIRFTLESAVLVRFEIWFPQYYATGKASTKIVGHDGRVLSESHRTHGEVPPRPQKTSRYVPVGQWTITVTTDTGLLGTTQFDIDSLDREHPVVRVDPK